MRSRRLRNHRELQAVWPQVKVLGARRVVFRVGGHKFRLVADMRYDLGRIYVRWVGTHEEYNDIKAEEV
jgi:mRNA interferase HigB